MVTLVFRCGTQATVDPDKDPSPVCAHCGTRQIAHTVGVEAPRISGHARGPLVQTRYLGPVAISVAEKGPLTMKETPDA